MTHYIAFLRGINVGAHRVKMERLRELFGDLGLSDVRTYIQTGNVFFQTEEKDEAALTRKIEAHLTRELGYEVPTFLRTAAELERSLHPNPYKDVEVTDNTRLLIAFTDKSLELKQTLPFASAKGDMEILAANSGEVFIVIRLINGKWGNLDPFLKAAFGAKPTVTTRFYDTTLKILKASQSS